MDDGWKARQGRKKTGRQQGRETGVEGGWCWYYNSSSSTYMPHDYYHHHHHHHDVKMYVLAPADPDPPGRCDE